jgi:hypothetical protein
MLKRPDIISIAKTKIETESGKHKKQYKIINTIKILNVKTK